MEIPLWYGFKYYDERISLLELLDISIRKRQRFILVPEPKNLSKINSPLDLIGGEKYPE